MAESFNGSDGSIVSVMDARQNRIYYAKFKREDGILKRLTDDTITPAESILTMCNKDDTILFDTLGYKKNPAFDFLKDKLYLRTSDEIKLQRGLSCALIASGSVNNNSVWKKSTDILPNYMQPSYAEMKHKK
jgi:tRNA A37 threonylcarbamoyladenosine modification protein TsaB